MIKKRHFLIVMGILLIGLIVGSFLDLQINQAIFSDRNGFGIAMAAFGTLPCYGGLAFLGGALFGTSFARRKERHMAITVGSYIAAAACYIISIYLGSKDIPSINGYNNEALKIPAIIVGIFLFAGIAVFGYLVSVKNDNKQLWAIIVAMIIVYIIGLIPVSYVIKLFIHRPRFRLVVNYGGIPFHNWWESYKDYKTYIDANPLINGFNITKEEFKSFPSGHTGSAAIMMMLLPYLSVFFKKLKGKETLLFYIGFAWTLLMMFSRMLVGAHYLTDTCMGAIILMVVFFTVQVFGVSKGWMFSEKKPEQEPVQE